MQHDFILLDRSGSMQSIWLRTLEAVNGYVAKLADEKVDTGVTLATFDSGYDMMKFEIVRDRIVPATWRPITCEITPRGGTPLNDAIGRIVALANAGAPNGQPYSRVAMIIMTDGEENASREISGMQAKALLDGCRKKDWQVIMLGANFANDAQAMSYGNMAKQTISSSTVNLAQTLRSTAVKRADYGATGQSIGFSSLEKANASAGI